VPALLDRSSSLIVLWFAGAYILILARRVSH
jgi:hypothetical protein